MFEENKVLMIRELNKLSNDCLELVFSFPPCKIYAHLQLDEEYDDDDRPGGDWNKFWKRRDLTNPPYSKTTKLSKSSTVIDTIFLEPVYKVLGKDTQKCYVTLTCHCVGYHWPINCYPSFQTVWRVDSLPTPENQPPLTKIKFSTTDTSVKKTWEGPYDDSNCKAQQLGLNIEDGLDA